jgi:hypothetical protein
VGVGVGGGWGSLFTVLCPFQVTIKKYIEKRLHTFYIKKMVIRRNYIIIKLGSSSILLSNEETSLESRGLSLSSTFKIWPNTLSFLSNSVVSSASVLGDFGGTQLACCLAALYDRDAVVGGGDVDGVANVGESRVFVGVLVGTVGDGWALVVRKASLESQMSTSIACKHQTSSPSSPLVDWDMIAAKSI